MWHFPLLLHEDRKKLENNLKCEGIAVLSLSSVMVSSEISFKWEGKSVKLQQPLHMVRLISFYYSGNSLRQCCWGITLDILISLVEDTSLPVLSHTESCLPIGQVRGCWTMRDCRKLLDISWTFICVKARSNCPACSWWCSSFPCKYPPPKKNMDGWYLSYWYIE